MPTDLFYLFKEVYFNKVIAVFALIPLVLICDLIGTIIGDDAYATQSECWLQRDG